MSLSNTRPGMIGFIGFTWGVDRPVLTPAKLYEAARKQVPREGGLIHGSLHNNPLTRKGDVGQADAICTLGAVIKTFDAAGEKYLTDEVAMAAMTELQEYNDSMPDVTPEVRKERVIGFLDAKIAALKVAP